MNSPANRIFILLVTFISIHTSFGQKMIIGAENIAMSNFSTINFDQYYFQNNASLLGFNPTKRINSSIQSHYISSEITTQSLGFSSPINNNKGIGFHITRDGINSFYQTSTGISYGVLLNESLAIGINTNINYLQIQKQYSKLLFIPEISCSGKFNSNWGYGIILHNPTRQSYHKKLLYSSKSHLTLGINYTEKEYKLGVEFNKSSNEIPQITIAGQYITSNKTSILFGFNTNSSFSGGISYKHQNFNFSLATQFHSTLGISPTLSFNYDFQSQN